MLDSPVLLITYRLEAKLSSLGRSLKEPLLYLFDVSRYLACLEPQMKTFSSSTHFCALLTWWDTLVFLEISQSLTIIKTAIGYPQSILLSLSDDSLFSESAPEVLPSSWFQLLSHCSFYFQQRIVSIFLESYNTPLCLISKWVFYKAILFLTTLKKGAKCYTMF